MHQCESFLAGEYPLTLAQMGMMEPVLLFRIGASELEGSLGQKHVSGEMQSDDRPNTDSFYTPNIIPTEYSAQKDLRKMCLK